jgi:hypothetical protein
VQKECSLKTIIPDLGDGFLGKVVRKVHSKRVCYVQFVMSEYKLDGWYPFSVIREAGESELLEIYRVWGQKISEHFNTKYTPSKINFKDKFETKKELFKQHILKENVHPRAVKPFKNIYFGVENLPFRMDFFAPFSSELLKDFSLDLYVCDCCLSFFNSSDGLQNHKIGRRLKTDPPFCQTFFRVWTFPGTLIYKCLLTDDNKILKCPDWNFDSLKPGCFKLETPLWAREVSTTLETSEVGVTTLETSVLCVHELDGKVHSDFCSRLILLSKSQLEDKLADTEVFFCLNIINFLMFLNFINFFLNCKFFTFKM